MPSKKQTKKQKVFLTRTKSAIFVAGFYVLYTLLLFFSNEQWFTPLNNLATSTRCNVQFTLNFFNVMMVVPIIYFVAREITNLCFPGKKGVFFYTVSSLFVLTVGISVYLLGSMYFPSTFGVDAQDPSQAYIIFLIVCLSAIVLFTIISASIWAILSTKIVYVGKKTRLWYPLLTFILNMFFVGFVCTTLIHSWTTFIFLIFLASGPDVFAYIGGVNFGKHKMCPKISPNKTWEGCIFGTLIALLIYCGLIGLFFIPGAEAKGNSLYWFLGCQWNPIPTELNPTHNLDPVYWAIYIPAGIVLILFSVLGDLFFSYIKRQFDIKDFSNLIPGHGGILDRIDSIISVFTIYSFFTIIVTLIFSLGVPGENTWINVWVKLIPNFAF